jgi:hypothetical protein
MKTKANRIRRAHEDVSTYLGYLEDEGAVTYPFETLLDAADEYLDFLEDTGDFLNEVKEHLCRAAEALDEEDCLEAASKIGDTLVAVDRIQKSIDEVER